MNERLYLDVAGEFIGKVVTPVAQTDTGKPAWIRINSNGKPFVALPLEVTEGEHKGKSIVAKLYLSDAAFDATTVRLAEVFGFDGDYASLGRTNFFAGKPCRFTTERENGVDAQGKPKTYTNVSWVNAIDRQPKTVVEESKVSSLMGKLASRGKAVAKEALKAAGAKPAAPAAATPPAAAAPAIAGDGPRESDDVPF